MENDPKPIIISSTQTFNPPCLKQYDFENNL